MQSLVTEKIPGYNVLLVNVLFDSQMVEFVLCEILKIMATNSRFTLFKDLYTQIYIYGPIRPKERICVFITICISVVKIHRHVIAGGAMGGRPCGAPARLDILPVVGRLLCQHSSPGAPRDPGHMPGDSRCHLLGPR